MVMDGELMKFEWDLTHIFKNDEEAKKVEEKLNELIPSFLEKLEYYFIDEDKFLEGILNSLKINEYLEQIYCYYKRFIDIDSNDEKKKEDFNRVVSNFYQRVDDINNKFYNLSIKNQEKINEFLKDEKLKKHKLYVERILLQNKHALSDEQIESFKNIKDITLSIPMTYRRIIEKEIKFPKIKDEFGNLKEARRVFISKDRKVRKKSYEASRKALYTHNSHVSTLYDMKISEISLLSKMQGFERVEDKNAIQSELPLTIRKNLLNKIVDNISISHKYIDIRKKIANLEKFYVYDLAIPFLNIDKKYDINDAIYNIKESLKPLGDDYLKRIDYAFSDGWVDLYPKTGKRFDSASMITYAGVPYLTLNYKDDFFSMRCLTHELGHSIHSNYAKENNDFEYFEYNLFIAEISSAVNEQFLFDYLKNNAKTKEEKDYILKEQISYYQNGIFNQTLLSLFEEEMYEEKSKGKVLEPNTFNEAYLKYQHLIYGDSIILNKKDSYDWITIAQFILNEPFYIWKYALDKCIALYIFKHLKSDSNYLNKYIKFLRAGYSMKTEDLLKIIDIDLNVLSFVDEALEEYRKLLEELENSIK